MATLRARAFSPLLAVLSVASIRASSSEPPAPDLAASLDRLVPRLMSEGDVPAVSLAIVKDGKVSLVRAWGVKEARKPDRVDEATIFEAASLSKPVFSYLVLKLAEAGRIDLDAPIATLLPGSYVDDPRQAAITARRVLSHTTGFPNWRGRDPLTLRFTPGERFSYSGEGFVYLQKAVERVTGETLDRLSKRLVFEPLGMTSSSFVWETRFEGRKATGHDAVGEPRKLERPTEASAAASLHTTARDYARFLVAALAGEGLRPATRSAMLQEQISVDSGCRVCVGQKPGALSPAVAWGLGWGLERTPAGPAIWHWGDNGSGFHAFVYGVASSRAGFVAFTNGLDGHGILPEILAAAIPGEHPSYAWLGYERHDSPSRTLFRQILAEGDSAIAQARERRAADPGTRLTEAQANRLGYWLLAKGRTKEAIAVFEGNVADFPESANVHDSLGEAYAAGGRREDAIKSYERSVALDPANANGVEALRKLRTGP